MTTKFFNLAKWKKFAKDNDLVIHNEGELANVVSFDGSKKLTINRWIAYSNSAKSSGGEFFAGKEWNYGSITISVL